MRSSGLPEGKATEVTEKKEDSEVWLIPPIRRAGKRGQGRFQVSAAAFSTDGMTTTFTYEANRALVKKEEPMVGITYYVGAHYEVLVYAIDDVAFVGPEP